MSPQDIAAVLVTVAAVSGYVNHRLLRLPATTGTLAVALTASLVIVGADALHPGLGLRASVSSFLGAIDFNETLMNGMLAFLLFAGALHLDAEDLFEHRWTIGALATAGVLISTVIVGVLSYWTFHAVGFDVPLLVCFVYGALISPTDPVAVIGLLKDLAAPRSFESQIAGESLFNDGIGVVVFFGLASIAGLSVTGHIVSTAPWALALAAVRQVIGGAALGAALGWVGFRALKSIDDYPLELLITLALAMFVYSASFWLGVSGPIAVVVAGLVTGNPGRRLAMSRRTREHVDAFWSMIDQVLNAVLFLLIGMEFIAVPVSAPLVAAALASIPIALVARFGSVAPAVAAMRIRGRRSKGLLSVLTWGGLRGGISIAMVLSLPPFPAHKALIACTYAVVLFSILVQGLSVRRLLEHYGLRRQHHAGFSA